MSKMTSPRDVDGVTLMELLVVLVIFAAALCFSPSLFHATPAFYREQMVNELNHVLQFSKLHAFLHQETLVLAPLRDQDWSKGARLFVMDGRTLPPRSKKEVHAWRWRCGSMRLDWHGFQSPYYMIIERDPAHLAMNGTFTLSHAQDTPVTMIVNRFGRVR